LLCDSVQTPRITVLLVKLDDPKDWPTPPPEDRARAPTLPYHADDNAAPPPSPTPPPKAYVRGTTLPYDADDDAAPPPPPAQER
jgi:hypothetical protein